VCFSVLLDTSRVDVAVQVSDVHCSALIKVLGGVAKWRHRLLLLRLCVATAILPEKKLPNFWQIDLTNVYNTIELIQFTFYTNEHPSFPPFSVLLQVRCQV